ncbi:MAG: hypothetical protein EBY22_14830 [Gammaproteobacteria bacterium]|nr:hypothetical protein [Gammaproteobacteria bacterium]
MLSQTWKYIFTALYYIGALGVIIFYFHPAFFTYFQTGERSPLDIILIVYVLLLVFSLLIWYFYDKPTFATVVGLWSIAPDTVGAEAFVKGKMVPASGKMDLLNETQSQDFLSDSFTFGFFISIDNASIEIVKGESLKNDKKSYQNLLVLPGTFNVSVDPLHETLRLNFLTHKAAAYEILIPTLQVHRWHQFVISIEGRTADVYQNGILLKSVILPNVPASRPGKPFVYMNSDMYARLAYVQSWPKRLKEKEVTDNYRWNSDAIGTPALPESSASYVLGIPNFNFCVGGYCLDTQAAPVGALNYVEYTYA